MQPSLSVIVPVYNQQRVIGQIVEQLIEILPELTSRFELLLVDDGSTDATVEAARELAAFYPQITVISHPLRLGMATNVRTGLARSSGEMVLIRDEDCRVDLHEIPKLWRQAASHDIIIAKTAPRHALGWIPQLPLGPGVSPHHVRASLYLLHRRVTRGWLTLGGAEELLTHLTRKGYPIVEVEVRPPRLASEAGQLADKIMQQLGPATTLPNGQRYVPQRAAAIDPKRPNYLAKIKAFALGE